MEAPERDAPLLSHELHSRLAPQSVQLSAPISAARATKPVQRPNDDPALRAQVQPRQPQCRLQLDLAGLKLAAEELLGAVDPVGDRVLVDPEPARGVQEARVLLQEYRYRRAEPGRRVRIERDWPNATASPHD